MDFGEPDIYEEQYSLLQSLWLEARYKEAGRFLRPVDKYNVRKAHPFPRNIQENCQIPENMKESAGQLFYETYAIQPYLAGGLRRNLSAATELTELQVATWFRNRRQRDKARRLAAEDE